MDNSKRQYSKFRLSVKMKITSAVLLSFVAVTNADNLLTTCTSLQGVAVPCLNDTVKGTMTNLDRSPNQTYNFSNLNITAIQDLPPDAKYVDLSYNQISEISRGIPSTLSFLNLSYNTLKANWTKIQLPVSTLDLSYNQGGLLWNGDYYWEMNVPQIVRLVFRGNQLGTLKWTTSNFPFFRSYLHALDLSDNPRLVVYGDSNVMDRIKSNIALTADASSYDDTLKVCGNRTEKIVKLDIIPVLNYTLQGEAHYGNVLTDQKFAACSLNYTDLYTPPPNGVASRRVEGAVLGLVSLLVLYMGL
ncbi:hypothetical protein AC1031_011264 [Aphanomyces cochlioides]|nr:hypothetical protein AC1031_011264 [Aphanomyces cochlioides]